MENIVIDDSRWPLLVIRYGVDATEADFLEHLKALESNLRRTKVAHTKTAIVYDVSSGYRAPPRVREMQADWMRLHATETRESCVGIAFVITSSIVRGALTAILWMSDMPAPYTVVSTSDAAEIWSLKQLALAGVRVAPKKQVQSG